MTPEQWRKVEELFGTAQELGPESWDEFLREQCGNDDELKRVVVSLLRYHGSGTALLSLDGPSWRGLFGQPAQTATFTSGVTFGPYLILRLLGSGGMGDVYLAEDTRLRRKVALKLLPAWFNSEERLVARFTQEAQAASALNHPNVPVVYEAGEIDQRHFIAGEFVDGSSLAERISHGPVPWREAVEIALQVARALQAAHAVGIVHRDVKPGNILVAKDGVVKLADFGIAKLAEAFERQSRADGSLTATGTVIGTPGYMAPEQAAGVQADVRSDLWSLAAVLHEMVAGKQPTPGNPRVAASKNLPPPLAGVLERALQPVPEKRYQNIEEFAAALRRARRALPLGWRAALTAGLAAVLAIVAIGFVIQSHRKPRAEPGFRTGEIVKLTSSGNVVDAVISPDSRYVIYSVEQSGQESLRLHQVDTGADIERIPFVNGHYLGLAFAPDGNYFYYTFDPHGDVRYLYEAPLLGGAARKIVDDIDSPPSFSPDGRKLAFIRGNTAKADIELHITDADGTQDRIIATRPLSQQFSNYGVAWSSDAKTIYSGALDEHSKAFLVGVEVSTGKQRRLSQPEWNFIGRVSLLRDGYTLVLPVTTSENDYSPKLIQFSTANGKWSSITSDLAGYEHAQSAGNDIVTVQQDRLSSVWIASARTLSVPRRITPPAGHFEQIAWSPDGTMVTSIQAGREENLWRVARDGATQQLTNGQFVDINPAVSPIDGTINFVSNRAGGWTVWTVDKNGNGLRETTKGEGIFWNASTFSPDGSILFVARSGGHFRIFRISHRGEAPSQLLSAEARFPAVSSDGRLLLCQIMDQLSNMQWQVAIVDLRTLNVVRRFPDIPLAWPLKWLPGETAFTYLWEENGVSNIWKTAIATGVKRPLTHFKEDKIFSFDWSLDARDLAMVRGTAASDVLLVRRIP